MSAVQEFPMDWVCCTQYGVPLASIGEEGELHVAPGKVAPRRMIAAVNRHERICLGLAVDERDAGSGDVAHAHAYRGKLGGSHPYGEPGDDYLRWGATTASEPRTIAITVLRGER